MCIPKPHAVQYQNKEDVDRCRQDNPVQNYFIVNTNVVQDELY